MSAVVVRRVRDEADLAAAFALRTEVFVVEQHVPAVGSGWPWTTAW